MKPELLKMAIILGLLSAIGPFSIDMYLPAMPAIATGFGVDIALSQWTLMSYFLAFGVSQLFYGPASDAFGRKPPLYFGLVVFVIASIGCAIAPTIEWLIGMRFIQGIGAASVMSIPRAVIRDSYRGNEATRLMSTVMLIISVSPMLAPLIGSALIVPLGWRSVFYAVAFIAIGSFLITRFILPETCPPEKRIPFNMGSMLHAFNILVRDPFFMGVTLIGAACTASFFIFLSTASFLYTEFYGLTPTQFALAFALNAVGFFSATQLAANFAAKFGPNKTVLGATIGATFFSLLLLIIFIMGLGSFTILVAILFLFNACLGLIIPIAMVLSLEEHGPIAGTASALGGTMQMVIAALAMVAVSFVFDGTPLPMVGSISVSILIALALSIAVLRRPAPTAA
jgi:DHA1 family bicyclomycin/chloramphenicol resistance-like MFS transporter